MPLRFLAPLLAGAVLTILPAAASADYGHVVAPGETLTSVAATDGLSIAALAAANGLSTQAELVAGSLLEIPPQTPETVAGPAGPADETTSASAPAATAAPADTDDSGGYVVQPGDTLSAIAARDGVTVDRLAAANGLNPNGILFAGATLVLPGDGSVTTTAAPATEVATGGPYPTDQYVDAPEIADIADDNGVPPSLAEAIGWQESGWNNDEVSDTGAVGVMQIEPGTWDWINRTLTAGTALEPASASDNVRGGVLLLRSLLDATGSDSLAAAGYYQGLTSVQEDGLYPSTQQYVNDVMSLEQSFGGG